VKIIFFSFSQLLRDITTLKDTLVENGKKSKNNPPYCTILYSGFYEGVGKQFLP
jgi:hypothetical protein